MSDEHPIRYFYGDILYNVLTEDLNFKYQDLVSSFLTVTHIYTYIYIDIDFFRQCLTKSLTGCWVECRADNNFISFLT